MLNFIGCDLKTNRNPQTTTITLSWTHSSYHFPLTNFNNITNLEIKMKAYPQEKGS